MLQRITFGAVLVGVVSAVSFQSASAEETYLAGYIDTCSHGIVGDAELLFLRPHRGDGFTRNDTFGHEVAPRFRIGYENELGAGIRVQYWSFNHSEVDGNDGAPTSIDLYNIDLDFYKRMNFGTCTSFELMGGIRYSDYEDVNFADTRQTIALDAWGGYVGGQLWQELPCQFRGYARGKWAIMSGDNIDNGRYEYDVTRTQQEIGLGIERTFLMGNLLATVQAGAEWHNWGDYQDNADSSIGFAGYVIGVNLQR